MKDLQDINLAELVEGSSQELIDERRKQASNTIKQLLQRIEQLARDIKRDEREVKAKHDKLTKAQEKIDKIKAGDWNLLAQLMQQKPDQKEED